MQLTNNEKMVIEHLKNCLSDENPSTTFQEIEDTLGIKTKSLRGILTSLSKKNLISLQLEKDAGVSFIILCNEK